MILLTSHKHDKIKLFKINNDFKIFYIMANWRGEKGKSKRWNYTDKQKTEGYKKTAEKYKATIETIRKVINFLFFCVLVIQSGLTLCDPMGCSPPGSSVHGILQAWILELVAIPLSRDLPHQGIEPGSPALQADSLPSESPVKPKPMQET